MQEERDYLHGVRELWDLFVTGPADKPKVLWTYLFPICQHTVLPWFFEYSQGQSLAHKHMHINTGDKPTSQTPQRASLIFGPLTAQ